MNSVPLEVAFLLVSAILVDTMNMSVVGRYTPRDIAVLEQWKQVFKEGGKEGGGRLETEETKVVIPNNFWEEQGQQGGQLQTKELYQRLQAERFNSEALTSYDLLRKDYKEWSMNGYRVGISAVLLDLPSFVGRGGAQEAEAGNGNRQEKKECAASVTLKWADKNDLDALLCMHASTTADGQFVRQLIVFTRKSKLQQDLVKHLREADIDLQLEPDEASETILCSQAKTTQAAAAATGDDEESVWMASCFHQRNNIPSRKKVQPCVVQFFNKYQQAL